VQELIENARSSKKSSETGKVVIAASAHRDLFEVIEEEYKSWDPWRSTTCPGRISDDSPSAAAHGVTPAGETFIVEAPRHS
jgi:hypothetical protein